MSKRKPKVTIVSFDDWTAMYIDGKLVFENHDIPTSVFLDQLEEHTALKLDVEFKNAGPIDDEHVARVGRAFLTLDSFKDLE